MKWTLLAIIVFSLRTFGQTGLYEVVNWYPSSSTNIASYNIYYGTSSGHYTNHISADATATSVRLDGFAAGTSYFMAVTAVDTSGRESSYSPEVYFTTPSSPILTVSQWQDYFGIPYAKVSSSDIIPRSWTLYRSTDMVNWTAYDAGFYTTVSEPYIETDLSYQTRMYFRIVMY